MRNPECIWNGGATLGESPVWVAAEQKLYWVDIQERLLFRHEPSWGRTQSWTFESRITSIAPRASGGYVATFAEGFAELGSDLEKTRFIACPEPERRTNRFNDAKVDPSGRFWAGTMDEREEQPSGALYRLDGELRCHCMDEGYVVSNGPAFSPDGSRLYCADSRSRVVYLCDLDSQGHIARKRNFLRFPDHLGFPDGMTVDSEECLWVCHWGGSRVTRFSRDGSAVMTIRLPVSNVTSCCFGGADLKVLYITSARQGIGPESLGRQPLAGGVFACVPGVPGVPAPCFAG